VSELLTEVSAPFVLSVVRTVAEARKRLADVDCVLLDLELPDASGLDALRELRSARPHVAVCVLTGFADEHLGATALAHGAQDYLVKGRVDGVLLERSVRYAVERRHAEDGALRLREAQLRQAESARVERGLLPHPLVDDGAIGLHTFYRAGRAMGVLGGDFYDAVQVGPGRIRAVVGDVCGHAAEEAALGVELRVAWRALTLAGVADDRLIDTMERVLVSERRAAEIFATLAMVTLDVEARRISVRTVGHPPPLIIENGRVGPLPVVASIVLGLVPGSPHDAVETALPDTAWSVLLYTDGLIEGRHGDDWLGTDGLCELVTGYTREERPMTELPEWLVAQAEARNGGPLADDVAMLLLCGEARPTGPVAGSATVASSAHIASSRPADDVSTGVTAR
jgi:serine phosphatase RsbU (regulator of sigma subunit)